MTLKLNGEKKEIRDGLSVAGLLDVLKIQPARVAVEVNLSIIKKDAYTGHVLHDGDEVEIVSFVGGG
jgi:sulfur carrier protein